MPACIRLAVAPPVSLIQIQQGYAADYYDLWLSVQADSAGWKVTVCDPADGRTLYSAQRCSLNAAKTAATEFALFCAAGSVERERPEAIARNLQWEHFWGSESRRCPRK